MFMYVLELVWSILVMKVIDKVSVDNRLKCDVDMYKSAVSRVSKTSSIVN